MTDGDTLRAIRYDYSERTDRGHYRWSLAEIRATYDLTEHRLSAIARAWGLRRYQTRRAAA